MSTLIVSHSTRAAVLAPVGSALGVLRFDAILELNAPLVETHVVLFARYWVGPDHYTIGIIWAEPHEGQINFPGYPVTLVIHSDREEFRLIHQVHRTPNARFTKPLQARELFQGRFNVYDLSEIRLAEVDARGSRIYAADLDWSSLPQDGWVERALSTGTESLGPAREARAIRLLTGDGRVRELRLFNKDEDLVKSIRYDYTTADGAPILWRERVELSPVSLTGGGEGTAVGIKMGDKEYTLRKFPIAHHVAGRSATVEYDTIRLNDRPLTIPARIAVSRTADGLPLRSARLFNFARAEQDAGECLQAARRFASLTDPEEKCRQMLLKYWLKGPSDVNESDQSALRALRIALDAPPRGNVVPALSLKQVNKFFELDWMLADGAALREDYARYLTLLRDLDLKAVGWFGGWSAIETTVRWGLFPAANDMLRKWVDVVVPLHSVSSALQFAQTQCRQGRFWSAVAVLDKLRARPCQPEERFETEALRCEALVKLISSIERAERLRDNFSVMQTGWVTSQVPVEKLRETARRSFTDALLLYSRLDNPGDKYNMLRSRVEAAAAPVLGQSSSPTDGQVTIPPKPR